MKTTETPQNEQMLVDLDATTPQSQPDCAVEVPDAVLMKRIAARDEESFTQLIARYGEPVGSLVGRMMGWHADCDDILQDVFLTLWQKASSFDGAGSVEGWLRKISINRCRNHFRAANVLKRKVESFANLLLLNEQKEPRAFHHEPDPCPKLTSAINQLRSADRIILVLYYLEEMTSDEVSETLNLKPETLHVRLHRARKRLKSILEEMSCEERP